MTSLAEKYPYGYSLDGDSVWFEMKWEDSRTGIDDRTGQRVEINYQAFHPIALAGDFNGWALLDMAQDPRVFSDWGTFVPKSDFPQGKSDFKFVVEGHIWIDPPATAPNREKSAVGHDSYNLVVDTAAGRKRKKKRTAV